MRTRKSGFTLIELLVTLAIMSLVMTALLATLQGTVKAHDEAEVDLSSVRDGPRILDMVEHDLRALHVYNMKEGNVLRGKSERPGGLRGDRIDFVCSNDSARRIFDETDRDEGADIASDLNEIGYRLRSSTRSDDFLELWRREDLFVDEEPFEGGTYEMIHEQISRFEITYLDHLGDKAAEETDWDMADKKKLPGAVRIDLELRASPELVGGFVGTMNDAQSIYRYTRVVAFHNDQTTALSIRPYLPTRITARNDNGGAGGGKGGKDGDTTGLGGAGGEMGGFGAGGGLGGEGGATPTPRTGTSVDLINNGGGAPAEFNFNFEGPGLDVSPGADGELSEQDQQKIENFLRDYRNRYGGSSGSGGS